MLKKQSTYISPKIAYDAVHKVLPFIAKYTKKYHNMRSPSNREISKHFGYTYNWGWLCTRYLRERGYLTTDPTRKYKNLILKNK